MHELGIADAMVRTIDRILSDQAPGAAVRAVTVELGQLSGVVERFLYDAWRAVTDGTAYADTALRIHPVPAMARCEDCGKIFVVDPEDLYCPDCRGDKLTPISGQDLTIAEIEVEDADSDTADP